MKIKVPSYMYGCAYYWYLLRCFHFLQKDGKIELEKTNDKFLYTQFVSVVFINDRPCIFDVRDDSALPLPELKKYPNALIFKSNYSTELWDNPPVGFEYPITDEERSYRSQVRQFVYGRAMSMDFNIDETEVFRKDVSSIKYDIISLSGAGVYTQQTKSRLDVYDLLDEIFKEKAKLCWFDRNHFIDKKNFPDYEERIKKYLFNTAGMFGYYGNYIKFLSEGMFSLNFPGIAVSQPFRLIDGVLANRCSISTKIYTDAYWDFPRFVLPVCGYFGTGDFPVAKKNLQDCFNIITPELYNNCLQASKEWYKNKLSVDGMLKQILAGLTEKEY